MTMPEIQGSPEEVAEHFAKFHNKAFRKKNWFEWGASKLWLIERGLIPDDRTPDRVIINPTTVLTSAIGSPPGKTSAGRDPESAREAVMVCMKDVVREDVGWLWPGRIPLDTVSMLVGIPGDGKSGLALSLASTVSVGGRWPDLPDEPVQQGSVVILQAEMKLSNIVRQRLDDAGADLSRIHVLTTMKEKDGRLSPFTLRRDMPALERAVAKLEDVRLVIIDPIGSYLQGADENKNSDVRELTDPLFKFAEDNHLALVLVAHLNKGMSTNILSRISGSIAFGASARMIWYVSRHPHERSKRVLSFVKGNLTDGDPKALTYQYRDGVHQFDAAPAAWNADDVARLLLERATSTSREALGSTRGPIATEMARAMEFILETLDNGPCLLGAAKEKALLVGLSRTTFGNALDHLTGAKDGRVVRFQREGNRRFWLRLATHRQGMLPVDSGPHEGTQKGDETGPEDV
jgi:putative DNA primase/helicase